MTRNHFNRFWGITALIGAIALMGCKKSPPVFASSETKMIGSWEYQKVRFTKEWSVSSQDETANYQSFAVTFFDDGTTSLVDHGTADTLFGTWNITQQVQTVFYDEDPQQQIIEELNASYVDQSSGTIQDWYWENLSVCSNTIRGTEQVPRGRYNYVMRRTN